MGFTYFKLMDSYKITVLRNYIDIYEKNPLFTLIYCKQRIYIIQK